MTESRRPASARHAIDSANGQEAAYAQARVRMVDEQIVARGVGDPRVLEAMRDLPRHTFVPADLRHAAYEDRPLPIGSGQTISQPYMVAVMTAVLGVGSGHRVLEVGTGSGYQAAVLGRLAGQLVSVERMPDLAARADEVLRSLGLSNVRVVVGDGSRGWSEGQPYDRILVTAGAPEVPTPLLDQLAPGGTLVVPVGSRMTQQLLVVRRSPAGDRLVTETLDHCVFVPLVGAHGWNG